MTATHTFRYPVDKVHLGAKFGVVDKLHPNGHRGTDYNGLPEKTPLKAVHDFKVVTNKWSGVLGWILEIEVADGVIFGYCHMKYQSKLKRNHRGKMGDVVGYLGNTGSGSTGAHLHFTLTNTPGGTISGKVSDAHAYLTKKIKAENEPKTSN